MDFNITPKQQKGLIAFLVIVIILLSIRNYNIGKNNDIKVLESKREPINIKIHVAGAVVYPGLYEMKDGDRVIDAINMAGGPLPEANLDALNLAKRLVDEDKILVLRRLDITEGSKEGNSKLLNINTATKLELEKLPGIGPAIAERIINERNKGLFLTIDEIQRVSGIGVKLFENIKEMITVE